MRRILLVIALIAFYCSELVAQGSCTTAYTIPLDGSCNTYTTSTTTGGTALCNGQGYGGNGRVTYFRFTTNSIPQCVSLDILASVAGTHIEAVLYSTCSSGVVSGGDGYQSLCMDDGNGIWATNLWWNNLLPNTTYYLRVRTEQGFTGTLRICGKFDTPTNNLCSGATGIDTLTTPNQNNACNIGSTEVLPSTLCAGSLENTAWYTFTVLTSGVSSVVISNLNCDNTNFVGGGSTDYGFQIGFFTGACGSLTATNCQAQTGAAGGTIIASSTSLPAGTIVHVAVDGFAGSNCKYDIVAINAAPLAVKMKFFEAYRADLYNFLTWVTLSENNNQYFEVERSADGMNFSTIGKLDGQINSRTEHRYTFNDEKPLMLSFYRLKQVDIHGVVTYSRIVRVVREALPVTLNITFPNPAHDILKLNLETSEAGPARLNIVDISGKSLVNKTINLQKGISQENLVISKLAPGVYYLIVTRENSRKTVQFIKN